MNVVADRLWRNPLPQPRWLGWFRIFAGCVMLLLLLSALARSGGIGVNAVVLLALGLANLGSGASTLLLTRSPAVAKVLNVASLVSAVGLLVLFLGGLLGRW